MKQFLAIYHYKTHVFNCTGCGTKKTGISIKWEIATELPADSGQQQSLGFAGPVTGVHNDILFIAGGANFPDSMPWQGGKKKYYNNVFVYTRKNANLFCLTNPLLFLQPLLIRHLQYSKGNFVCRW